MSDYAEHTVALDAIHEQIKRALREKRYAEADKLCADAMSRLARLHVCIKSIVKPIT